MGFLDLIKFKKTVVEQKPQKTFAYQTRLYSEQALSNYALDWTQRPDDMLLSVGGRKSLKALKRDVQIGAACDTREEGLRSKAWRIVGPRKRDVKFISDIIKKNEEQIFTAVMNSIWYGYSVSEAVYDIDPSGMTVLKFISEKPLEWFEPQHGGKVRFSVSFPGEKDVKIDLDPKKFFLSVNKQTYENRYGDSVLSKLYPIFISNNQLLNHWDKYVEKFGSPFLVGKTENVDQENGNTLVALKDALERAIKGASIAVDKDTEINTVDGVTSFGIHKESAQWKSEMIRVCILGQTLTTANQGGGSNALGNVHKDIKDEKTIADMRIAEAFINKIVKAIHELNQLSGDPPQFVFELDQELGAERASRDQILFNQGVRFTKEYYVNNYEFEDNEIEVIDIKSLPNFAPQTQFKFAGDIPEKQKTVDGLKESVLSSLEKSNQKTKDKLLTLIKSAKSEEEFNSILQAWVIDQNDPALEKVHDGLYQSSAQGLLNE